ncbi:MULTISPECIES: hypothetical protein [Salegentibacter]|jgi:hypothetical protein|uniref:Uncharacterized protein n=2 Tax=Salegentibacter TaxID=143222 RepID=A0A0Q9ZPE6_9FLAO|nr:MULTISPECIES: hypothetical protein [Salegentibacter]KRG30467.1 hypothetical protein APR42_00975 [Salegentibacter mishustinae]OEY73810.1 hypothetical protein BHS39_07545 [Salegentibacter salarius]PKD21270.1 hypothetical protein APR40_07540 [Salegentibacter salarius]PNW23360.1 hypothetical protein APB85_00970 [Salegentibacter mishustinae]PZX66427.1 hypothetical protein LY54_00824 [Salegentibacter mishustinae]|tara:strand:+ start:387 stop:575 length:189 start_codon:yes stop_codon:yes gene_type:complete
MFSTGQLVFAGLFVVVFVIIIVISYKKDTLLHKKQYKGSIWVLLAFLAFIGLLFILKTFLNP